MKRGLLSFHQSYTDIILCIPLIFYNIDLYDELIVICREEVKDMMIFLFRKYNNVSFLFLYLPDLGSNYGRTYGLRDIAKNKYPNYDLLFYGYWVDFIVRDGSESDESFKGRTNPWNDFRSYFYSDYNLDRNLSINKFIIDRDEKLEDIKYNEIINNIGCNYIITNEDIERNLLINKNKYITCNNLPIFNLNNSSKICFDMIKVIENAKEIHLISTFWSLIIYQLQKKYNLFLNIPIYFHNYTRDSYCINLYENNNWIIIN